MTSADRLRVRPVRWAGDAVDADDLAAVLRLYEAFETDRIGSWDSGPADIEAALLLPSTLRDETALVLDGDDAVGVAWLKAEPATSDVFADLAVLPGEGERVRCERAVRHIVDAARRHASSHPEQSWLLRTGAWTTDPVLTEVLETEGLETIRRFHRMRIECDSPAVPAVAPPLPPGVALVVRDDDETRRAIWAVDNDAFLDHYNFAPTPYDEWWAEFSVGATRDPDGWWLLTIDGDPAALCILDDSRAEQNDGYVCILGVRKPYRGRGLATLLLQRAFVRERDRGRAGVQLGVDAENTTGAVGLYERVGMRAVRTVQGYALRL